MLGQSMRDDQWRVELAMPAAQHQVSVTDAGLFLMRRTKNA
jgi:hypothetical protein